jgi:hypothetical protein
MKLAAPAALLALWLAAAQTFADDESAAQEFAASVERLSELDPQSPNTLTARLAYADFQAKRGGAQCPIQLDDAQKQLDLVAANPALPLILPGGLARAAALDYLIHAGRSSCNASAETRERELRAALESAKRAAQLYHDGYDAVAMATMQFNVAVTYRSLGDTNSALAALQAVLDIDREYGFGDDAEDNYQVLLEWHSQASGAEDVAAHMQDFPERSTLLTFAWVEGKADVTLQTDITKLVDDESVRIQSSRSAMRDVRKGLHSWIVAYERGENAITMSQLPTKATLVQETANSFAHVLTSLHDFVLARNGDYDDSRGGFKFAAGVHADAKRLKNQIDSMGAGAAPLGRRVGPAIQAALLPRAGEPRSAEQYNLEAGTWIGAALDQGVWYPMTAALSLPLAPGAFVAHKMEFAYTRSVPCVPGSTALSCVEIVLHAAPDPTIVQLILDKLARANRLPPGQHPQLWSVTEMRLVTDPTTLQPYRLEMRRHGYWWTGKRGEGESLIESSTTIESLVPRPTPASP